MRVAAYTGGVMVPSARARVRQYIGPLNRLGIQVREYPLPWGNILPRPFALRPHTQRPLCQKARRPRFERKTRP